MWEQLRSLMPEPLPQRYPFDTVALFPPRDDAAKALQLVIGSATRSVKVEMFTYCDAAIDALLHQKAATVGIDFQMTLDESEAERISTTKALLAGWNGDKRIAVGKSEHGQIIHRKIVIVDHLYVAGGSTNWTHPGEYLEDNELVIRRCAPLAHWYEQVLDANFERVRQKMTAAGAAA